MRDSEKSILDKIERLEQLVDDTPSSPREKLTYEQLQNCKLKYTLSGDDRNSAENFRLMKHILDKCGIMLDIYEDELTLSVIPSAYSHSHKRHAGPKDRHFSVPETDKQTKSSYYRLSDILLMMQSMQDKEIITLTGIPSSTFYRHKRKMYETWYYKTLDPEKEWTREYLESVENNFWF